MAKVFSKTVLPAAMVAIALLAAGGIEVLREWQYTPKDPPRITRQFVELVERGDLRNAYALTNEGAMVGTTQTKFEENVRRQFGITDFPIHRQIREILQNTAGLSYAAWLKRRLQGREADYKQIGYEVFFTDDKLPKSISISLKVDHLGRWRIKYFESHAG